MTRGNPIFLESATACLMFDKIDLGIPIP